MDVVNVYETEITGRIVVMYAVVVSGNMVQVDYIIRQIQEIWISWHVGCRLRQVVDNITIVVVNITIYFLVIVVQDILVEIILDFL